MADKGPRTKRDFNKNPKQLTHFTLDSREPADDVLWDEKNYRIVKVFLVRGDSPYYEAKLPPDHPRYIEVFKGRVVGTHSHVKRVILGGGFEEDEDWTEDEMNHSGRGWI